MAEVQDFDGENIGEIEAVEQANETPVQEAKELPDKYKGKSLEDIVKMHQEAEKLIDRQGQEVGEIRKLADELIKSQLHTKPEQEKQPKPDFFDNPDEAVRQAVESNPAVLEARQIALQARQEQARQAFVAKHPDYTNVMGDPEFANWVKSSPIRIQLLRSANDYNVDAADELFSTYKAIKGVRQSQVSEAEKTARTETLKAASVDSGGSGERGKKIYRRADLVNLKLRDPQRFDAMQEEIDAAYREGRVK